MSKGTHVTGQTQGVSITKLLEEKLGSARDRFLLPPPVYETIAADVIEVDTDAGSLVLRFPMLERYLNPYGTMQGGMIAAAVDNTIGPLSLLVAPANVTRTLQLEYLKPAKGTLPYIDVKARLAEHHKRRLVFEAEVFDPDGNLLATSRSVNLVIAKAYSPK